MRQVVSRIAVAAGLAWLASPPRACAQWLESDAQAVLKVQGSQSTAEFGWLVDPLGDVNGDGCPDFVVSAPFQGASAGRISVHSGIDGMELWSASGTGASAVFGAALESVADQDLDGVRDVLTSAPYLRRGIAYLYSGASGALIKKWNGVNTGDAFGYSVSGDGDYDGDGIADLAIGSIYDSTAGTTAGRVYVYSGATLALITSIDPPVSGEAEFGTGLNFVGDVNADGRSDLAIANRHSLGSATGRLHVFTYDGVAPKLDWSVDGVGTSFTLDGDHVDAGLDLSGDAIPDISMGDGVTSTVSAFSGFDGSSLYTVVGTGSDGLGCGSGGLVADQNGDGLADLFLGADRDGTGGLSTGKAYLCSGKDGSVLRTWTFLGEKRSSFGSDVDLFSDLNGDGSPEFLVGASGNNQFAQVGRAFLMAGIPCAAAATHYGAGVAGTRGVPTLTASAPPVEQTSITLDLDNSAGAATIALLITGVAPASIPGSWGGDLLVQPSWIAVAPLPSGGLSLPFAVPLDTRLCGFALFVQALELDSGAARGLSSTDGLELLIGD